MAIGSPAYAHWVTQAIQTTQTQPVYGWVLVSSQNYQVIKGRFAMATAPSNLSSEMGKANAFASGGQPGLAQVNSNQGLTMAREIARAGHAIGGSSNGVSGTQGFQGTWYGVSGRQRLEVVVDATEVEIAPRDLAAETTSLPLSNVSFSGLSPGSVTMVVREGPFRGTIHLSRDSSPQASSNDHEQDPRAHQLGTSSQSPQAPSTPNGSGRAASSAPSVVDARQLQALNSPLGSENRVQIQDLGGGERMDGRYRVQYENYERLGYAWEVVGSRQVPVTTYNQVWVPDPTPAPTPQDLTAVVWHQSTQETVTANGQSNFFNYDATDLFYAATAFSGLTGDCTPSSCDPPVSIVWYLNGQVITSRTVYLDPSNNIVLPGPNAVVDNTVYVDTDPLVVDVGDRGTLDVSKSDAIFDITGQGRSQTQWIGPHVGLLVWDPHHTGRIRSAAQLFGNDTWGKSWTDGYSALATLDRDHDGYLKGHELDNLAIWVDKNSDGITERGEVKPLKDWGITRLAVRPSRGASGIAQGAMQRTASGQIRQIHTWDWIAKSQVAPKASIYSWQGVDRGRRIGGLLFLERQKDGILKAMSVPIRGVAPTRDGKRVGVLMAGTVEGDRAHWTSLHDGTAVSSQASLADGGWVLVGKSDVEENGFKWSYHWRADLLEGPSILKP